MSQAEILYRQSARLVNSLNIKAFAILDTQDWSNPMCDKVARILTRAQERSIRRFYTACCFNPSLLGM